MTCPFFGSFQTQLGVVSFLVFGSLWIVISVSVGVMTATALLVVPRSMPIAFLIVYFGIVFAYPSLLANLFRLRFIVGERCIVFLQWPAHNHFSLANQRSFEIHHRLSYLNHNFLAIILVMPPPFNRDHVFHFTVRFP